MTLEDRPERGLVGWSAYGLSLAHWGWLSRREGLMVWLALPMVLRLLAELLKVPVMENMLIKHETFFSEQYDAG
jgi:hypothetical protein